MPPSPHTLPMAWRASASGFYTLMDYGAIQALSRAFPGRKFSQKPKTNNRCGAGPRGDATIFDEKLPNAIENPRILVAVCPLLHLGQGHRGSVTKITEPLQKPGLHR